MFVIEGSNISSLEGTTQGNPTAITIHAITIISLVLMATEVVSSTPDNTKKMVAYADDFTEEMKPNIYLKQWWKTLCKLVQIWLSA